MPMITSGSLKEPKNEQQGACHSQSSNSIRGGRLARPLRSLCDCDHKNAHFVVASFRLPSAETPPQSPHGGVLLLDSPAGPAPAERGVNKKPALRPPPG